MSLAELGLQSVNNATQLELVVKKLVFFYVA